MKFQSGLTVIVVVAALVTVISIGESYAPEKNPHSSKDEGPTGSMALYLLLQEYTTVKQVESSLKNLEPGTLLIIGPVRPLSDDELEYLSFWVEEGSRVVVFSDDLQVMQQFGVTVSAAEETDAVIQPVIDHWSTEHVEEIRMQYDHYFTSVEGEILFADGKNPLVVEVKKGEGELFLICGTSMVWNENIRRRDNEIFLVSVALSDTVYFDEYHLYRLKSERGISLESLKALVSGYRPFFIQLLIVLALFMVAYGKRFGIARPAAPPQVQSSELVVSAADLYYKAKKKEILDILEEDQEPKNL
jgi:hypothetical protein